MKKLLKTTILIAATFAFGCAAVACGDDDDKPDTPQEPDKYTVSYEVGTGTGTAPTGGEYAVGAKFDLEEPTTSMQKEDNIFDGWLCSADGIKYEAGDEFTMPEENVTFTAQWTPENPATTYSITYDLNGGKGTLPTEANKAAGAKFDLASSAGLTKTNYTFDGWLCDADSVKYGAGDEFTMPAEDVTFTAQWKADKYTVQYELGAGVSGTAPASASYEVGATVTVEAGTSLFQEGKKFIGWKNSETNISYTVGQTFTMPAKAVTLTAEFVTDNPGVTYTVQVIKSTNDSQVSSIVGEIPVIENKAAGDTFTIPADTFSFAHYHQTFWRVQHYNTQDGYWETDGNYAPDAQIVMPENNIRITAVWVANDVTISFDANGGTGTMADTTKPFGTNLSTVTAAFDCKFKAPAGKVFQYWSLSPNGSQFQSGTKLDASIVSAEDTLTLYAVWETPAEPLPAIDLKEITGLWTDASNTHTFSVDAEKFGNTYAQASGILDGQYAVSIFIDESGASFTDLGSRVAYTMEYQDSALTLTPYTYDELTETSTPGTPIVFTNKTALPATSANAFDGNWAKPTTGDKYQPWIIDGEKVYYGDNFTGAKHAIIGSDIVLSYEVIYGTEVYILHKDGAKLTGYYVTSDSEKDIAAVDFNSGVFYVLTVNGELNQIVSVGGNVETSKLPTSDEEGAITGWLIEGTNTPFDPATDTLTANTSITAVHEGGPTVSYLEGSVQIGLFVKTTYVKIKIGDDPKDITFYDAQGNAYTASISGDYSTAGWKDQTYGSDAYYFGLSINNASCGILIKADKTACWIFDGNDDLIDGAEFK